MIRNFHHPLELQGHAKYEDQLKLSAKEAAASDCQGWMKSCGRGACFLHGSILERNAVRCCQQGAGLCGAEGLSCSRSSPYRPDSPFLLAAEGAARPALRAQCLARLPCSIPSVYSPLPLEQWFSISLAPVCWGQQQ